MTHSTEIDAKNGYQFLTRLTCSVMPVFLQHQFMLYFRAGFVVRFFSANFRNVCHGHKTTIRELNSHPLKLMKTIFLQISAAAPSPHLAH